MTAMLDRLRRVAPRQVEAYVIGTLKSQAQRGVFYFSMYNFAQILFISYTNGAYGEIFPSFASYLAVHALGFLAIIAVDYILVLPGEKDYQKRQDYIRDPLRDDVQALQEQIEDLQEELQMAHGDSGDE